MDRSGININDIKENNRALILRHICTNNGISRIELARITGLTKMTLTNITNDLMKAGFICEASDGDPVQVQAVSNSVGRRPIMLTISENSPVVAGIWVSRDFCIGVLTDLKANIISDKRIDLGAKEDNRSLMDKITDVAKSLCGSTKRKVTGIGISAIGPVDARKGMLLKPTDFYDISNLNVCDELTKALGLPAFIEEDMDASALAECYFGRCKDVSDFIYVGITNGVGSGIINGGELFHGGAGFGGEFGHTSIDYNGKICHCRNRGCIELYASVPNIIKNYNERYEKNVTELVQLVRLGEYDKNASVYLDDICEKLAIALAGISNILDPTMIIIGNEGYYFSDAMLRKIENRLNEIILVSGYKKIMVQHSAFGAMTSMIGSATIVMDKIFRSQLSIMD